MTKGSFLGSLLVRMEFGGLLTGWSSPPIRLVYWHLHPYILCKFYPIMLQVEAGELCFLGSFGSRVLGWWSSATEMLSHQVAKVEEGANIFFSLSSGSGGELMSRLARCPDEHGLHFTHVGAVRS